MRNRKRILVLMLSMLLVFSNTMLVSAEETQEDLGTLFYTYDEYLNTNSPMHREFYYEDMGQKIYPIFSDLSDMYSTDGYRVIGYFSVADSPIEYNVNYVYTPTTGSPSKGSSVRVLDGQVPDYKSYSTYDSYYKDYLAQFGINDENYDDFIEQMSGKYFHVWLFASKDDSANLLRQNALDGQYIELFPLNQDGSKYSEDSISTLKTTSLVSLKYYDFIPFLYQDNLSGEPQVPAPDDGGGGDGYNDKLPTLDIKIETEHYWAGITRRYRWDFIWNYEKYAIYKENPSQFNIEVRYIRGVQKGFLDGKNADIVPDDSLTWTTKIKFSDNYNVSTNLYSAYQKDIIDTYGKTLQGNSHGVYDIRVVAADGRSSNWVRITTNSAYGNAFKIDEVDDDGNVTNKWLNGQDSYPDGSDVDNEVTDYVDGNPDMSDNTDPDANSNDIDVKNVISTLKSLVSSIGELPSLVSKTLSFLPDSFITLLSCSLSLLVVISIVKWLR